MENLLAIRDLKVNFYLEHKEINAVNGVDLDIGLNEVVILAGESGSGKTITALSTTRILPKNARIISGTVHYKGEDLLKLDEKTLAKIRGKEIAYIFQEPTSYLNPVYTIESQISEAIVLNQNKNKRQAKDLTIELLNLVKIKNPRRVLASYPHQLSGGMNQRVFIAMSLACKPRLLIADEPTTSLDVTVESGILKLLLALKEELGFSLLFITHNLSIAQRIADRICIMYQGKVVEQGDKDKIFNSPEHFHTKELIHAYEKIGKI